MPLPSTTNRKAKTMAIGHRPFGQKMSTSVEGTDGAFLGKVRRKVKLAVFGANSMKVDGYTYHTKVGKLTHMTESMGDMLAWYERVFPGHAGATTAAYAVVQDGRCFRVYDDADKLGDADHLKHEVQAPKRCATDVDARKWFVEWALSGVLNGTYEFV